MANPERKQVLLRLDQDLYDQVKEMADYYGGPGSINATIIRYIRMGLTVDEGVNSRERDRRPRKGARSD